MAGATEGTRVGKDVDRLQLRPVTAGEFAPWADSVSRNFGEEAVPARVERLRRVLDYERVFAVFDGTRIVGNGAAFSFDVSLPGGSRRACAGITTVGVASDWRRRGLLRRMMARMLEQSHERGEPFAALYASESTIYGRFGFGIAAPVIDLEIDTLRTRIREPVGTDEVDLVDVPTACATFPAIYEAARRQRAGMMSISEAWWRNVLEHDDPDRREGMSPRHLALVPGRGFAMYRWKDDFDHMAPAGRVEVSMLVATDPDAESALWELLFDIDLTVKLRAPMRPPDDALLAMVDNRALVRDIGAEHLYLRLVELPAALTSRAYAADGSVSFTVTDATCPWNAGTWQLTATEGAATCEKVDGHGDIALDVADLAAIALGGVRLDQLVRARRAVAHRPDRIVAVDRMFASERAPWNGFEF